ncbi:MAG: hypothetical protein V3U02_04555 [Calditrichia bacterium]
MPSNEKPKNKNDKPNDEAKTPKLETIYVRVAKSFPYESRRRAGMSFGLCPGTYHVSESEKKAIENDSELDIVSKDRFERDKKAFESADNSSSVKDVKATKKAQKEKKDDDKQEKKSDNDVEVEGGLKGNSAIARKANEKMNK